MIERRNYFCFFFFFLPVITISFGQYKGEEEIEDNLSIVDAVAGDVGHEPVPEFGEGPEKEWRLKLILHDNIFVEQFSLFLGQDLGDWKLHAP